MEPHQIVRQRILSAGLSITEASKVLGVSRQALNNVVNGKSQVTAEMAARLANNFGIDPEQILGRQVDDELEAARQRRDMPFAIRSMSIKAWANQGRARGELPELVRRLIRASGQGGVKLDVPAGDEIKRVGVDGVVAYAGAPCEFVPMGRSIWEMSTQATHEKAEADYEKRPGDADVTYVAVTARSWPAAVKKWQREKNAEGKFKDVRLIDASDLEQWLEVEPAVAYWFAPLLGIARPEIQPLGERWEELSRFGKHGLSKAMVLAGRDQQVRAFQDRRVPKNWRVQLVSDSVDESVAFVAASLSDLELESAVLVDDAEALRSVIGLRHTRLIICTGMEEPGLIQKAVESGIRVAEVRARGERIVVPALEIQIPRVGPEPFAWALASHLADGKTGAEISWEKSQKAFAEARGCGGSVTAYMHIGGGSLPGWATVNSVPFLLANGWVDDNPMDRKVLTRLAAVGEYGAVDSRLSACRGMLYQVDRTWGLLAPVEAWAAMVDLVSANSLDQFRDVAIEVLSEPDLSRDARSPRYSKRLRQGIARTLVILATRGNANWSNWAGGVVRDLLTNKIDLNLWVSLAEQLPDLAESAPEDFLEAVGNAVGSTPSPLEELFGKRRESIKSSEKGHHLIQALETLAWFPDTFPNAVRLLGQIDNQYTSCDEKETQAFHKLESVFRPWPRATAVSTDDKLAMLKQLAKEHPGLTWKLLVKLLRSPDRGTAAWRPQWREASVDGNGQSDVLRSYHFLVRLALELATEDGDRCLELIDYAPSWSTAEQTELVNRFAAFAANQQAEPERQRLWTGLRDHLRLHESGPTEWSKSPQFGDLVRACGQLQPESAIARGKWLFDDQFAQVRLPQSQKVDDERLQGVHAILREAGWVGVCELVRNCRCPDIVGETVAKLTHAERNGWAFLEQCEAQCEKNGVAKAIEFFVQGLSPEERNRLLSWPLLNGWPVAATVALCLGLPKNAETWTGLLPRFGPEVAGRYWRDIFYFSIQADCLAAARNLIGAGRYREALELGANYARSLTPEEAAGLLEDLVEPFGMGRIPEARMVEFYTGQLFKRSYETEEPDDKRLARLELALGQFRSYGHEAKAIRRLLAQSPDLFADLVRCSYPTDDELGPAHEGLARTASQQRDLFLMSPGADFFADGVRCKQWFDRAMEDCKLRGVGEMGAFHLGSLLARSPCGADGIWPADFARAILEDDIANSLEEGILNGGIVAISQPQRQLAQRHRTAASQLRISAPRTARLLNKLADNLDDLARYWARHEERRRFE